jgi:hypothetical protein
MPTKAELIQLQKLYKTDEKIGERLGGVPAYLVAYWRRKKNVPRHSVPETRAVGVRLPGSVDSLEIDIIVGQANAGAEDPGHLS